MLQLDFFRVHHETDFILTASVDSLQTDLYCCIDEQTAFQRTPRKFLSKQTPHLLLASDTEHHT